MKTGVSYERAARTAGIGRSTLWRWLTRGEADHSEGRRTSYAKFWEDFKRAEAAALGQLEINLWQQSAEDWRAAAWILSRKAPREYGDADVTAELKEAIVNDLFAHCQRCMTPNAFSELLNALLSWTGEPEPAPLALAE
jgi:hypothetical protein